VEIGAGFGSNSNKIWTLDFNYRNIKNNDDVSTRPIYKRKSLLLNQSITIKSETPVVFLHGLYFSLALSSFLFFLIFNLFYSSSSFNLGLAAGSAVFLLNFDSIFESGTGRRVFAIDILG
jgi:Na+(H+)/acetate symporter ActP